MNRYTQNGTTLHDANEVRYGGTVRGYGGTVRWYGSRVRWYGRVVRSKGTVVRSERMVVQWRGMAVRWYSGLPVAKLEMLLTFVREHWTTSYNPLFRAGAIK